MEHFLKARASDPRFASGVTRLQPAHNVTKWEPFVPAQHKQVFQASAKSKDEKGDSDKESDDDGELNKKKKPKGIFAKNSDADGDGKIHEGKGEKIDFADRDGNGKPDAFESKKKKAKTG